MDVVSISNSLCAGPWLCYT